MTTTDQRTETLITLARQADVADLTEKMRAIDAIKIIRKGVDGTGVIYGEKITLLEALMAWRHVYRGWTRLHVEWANVDNQRKIIEERKVGWWSTF